jgi:cytochrome oxidase Cu insertion factor (SCO1/SenC/PrrC family)
MILRLTRKRKQDREAADARQGPPRGRCGPVDGQARRTRRLVTFGLAAAVAAAVAGSAAFALARASHHGPAQPLRPSGIPASISTRLANLMELSPLPRLAAPGFTLTDQSGRTMSLSGFRGKVVVLEFMDPHCTDICPIESQQLIDAYHDLGPLASKVIFAAVNVNQYYRSVRITAGFSAEHRLTAIPSWHFFTGPTPALRAAWRSYNIDVRAPNPGGDIVHTSAVYFIGPRGTERYLASPQVGYTKPRFAYHTKNETGYLPAGQLADWGHGIALVVRDLAG